MPTLEVAEGRKTQGPDEQIAYTVTTTNVGSSPSSVAVTAWDLTDDNKVVTGTVLNGSASVSGDVITTPTVQSLTAGRLYRIEVKFTSGGNVFEHYFEIQAEKQGRDGMSHIIQRLRRMVNDASATVWPDHELLDVLDTHRRRIEREQLEGERTLTSGTTVEYKRFHSRWENLEGGGTTTFMIEDSAGAARGTADYTADYIGGAVTMTADQGGTVLYLSAWTYDLPGAAADCWRERSGMVSDRFDFSADGQRLSRSQWFEHCQAMVVTYEKQARVRTQRQWTHGVFDDC